MLLSSDILQPFPPPGDGFPSHLERLAFGEDGFPKRGGGGASAEGGAAQGDLGLPAGDGGGTQRCRAPASGDGGIPHGNLGLPPLDAGVAQRQGRLPLGETGVAHRGDARLPDPESAAGFGVHSTLSIARSCGTPCSASPQR